MKLQIQSNLLETRYTLCRDRNSSSQGAKLWTKSIPLNFFLQNVDFFWELGLYSFSGMELHSEGMLLLLF